MINVNRVDVWRMNQTV